MAEQTDRKAQGEGEAQEVLDVRGGEPGDREGVGAAPAQEARIPTSVKVGYTAAAVAMNVVLMYVPTFISVYYTDLVGISATTIGTIMLVTKFIEGLSDIFMGTIVDRTKTRLGKARPWILAGGIGCAVCLYLLFSCPEELGEVGTVLFCAATYFLTCPVFMSILSVAEGAIIPMISSDEHGRTVLGLINSFALIVITILVSVVTPIVISAMGESRLTYRIVTGVYCILTVISAIVAVVLLREHGSEGQAAEEEGMSLKETLSCLVHNKYFIYLAVGSIAYNTALMSGGTTYYAKYVLGDIGYASLFTLCQGATYVLIFFSMSLRKKMSLRQLFTGGFLIMAAGCLLMFFANDNLVLIVISMALRGVGALPFLCYAAPLTGYISDDALYRTGKHMDGVIYSGYSMGGKIGTGLGSALVGWIIGLAGYVGTAEVQTASAVMSIRVVNSLVPMAFALLAAWCFSKITVEDGIEDIQRELKEKNLRS